MRSTVSIKTFILTLVIFFIGVSSFFFYLLFYRPKVVKAARGTREIIPLKRRVDRDPFYIIPPINPRELPREASSSESQGSNSQ